MYNFYAYLSNAKDKFCNNSGTGHIQWQSNGGVLNKIQGG